MAANSLTAYNSTVTAGLAKVHYLPGIQKAFNTRPVLYNTFSKLKSEKSSAAGWHIPVTLEGNFGGAFFASGGVLPTTGTSDTGKFTGTFTEYATGIKFNETQLTTLKDSGPTSYANLYKKALEDALDSTMKMFNIYLYGDGSGNLATVSATISTVTCYTGSGDKAYFLRNGMYVDVINSGTPRSGSPQRIDGIASDFSNITLATTIASTDTPDTIVQTGSYGIAFKGLKYHINNSGTYQGIARADYPHALNSFVLDGGSTDLTVDRLRRVFGKIWQKGPENHDKITMVGGPDQLEKFNSIGWQLKRWSGDAMKFDPGFKVLEFEGQPFVVDSDVPAGELYFVDPTTFFWIENRGLSINDDYTGPFQRVLSSGNHTASLITWLCWSGDLICRDPRANARISSLSYSSDYRTNA